jgi:phosphoribosylanthranilate isomerase
MWIKICANTNLDDAQLAAELGADAVGFVFAPSKRRVTAAEVARITPHLPASVERVGVFPALEAEEIAHAAEEAGLNAVQLHGGVNVALLRQLRDIFDERVKLIQTVHWHVDAEGANTAAVARHLQVVAAEGIVDRVLIDSSLGSATGGTGISFDWNDARSTLEKFDAGLKLIVAGGLRQDNVAEAIRGLNPWGVDVASGVEESPGKKSRERLTAFIQVVRNANASIR